MAQARPIGPAPTMTTASCTISDLRADAAVRQVAPGAPGESCRRGSGRDSLTCSGYRSCRGRRSGLPRSGCLTGDCPARRRRGRAGRDLARRRAAAPENPVFAPGWHSCSDLSHSLRVWSSMTLTLVVLMALQAQGWQAGVDSLAKRGDFSGVVRVARNGVPEFEQAYGMADREAGRPNTTETSFNIGSINKFFTGIAIRQLAAQEIGRAH